jgi:hypothetical protein
MENIIVDQRRIEKLLADYMHSFRITIDNAAGEPFVGLVCHFEFDETVVAEISLEKLAGYLAQELAS